MEYEENIENARYATNNDTPSAVGLIWESRVDMTCDKSYLDSINNTSEEEIFITI
jgi:hypothetical protein